MIHTFLTKHHSQIEILSHHSILPLHLALLAHWTVLASVAGALVLATYLAATVLHERSKANACQR